ncbi:cytochrome c [Fictibacillus sp. WQ 8-8]|uniref:c-type cytochrome n=1 Tax=unclassified Fictibacillus TaxID=2644029 RepID=UPI0007846E2E|nr:MULTISPECIES: cytochrome c [unclassified Fictibacillus]MCQ6268072.1 cytochrome c [Fictibacillus sp. WQ 8-8]MED2971303.1 cytochrome c [Fictibacillus sp. B-59209]SFD52513.1 cytochrome c551 [Bacillus sp. OV194]
MIKKITFVLGIVLALTACSSGGDSGGGKGGSMDTASAEKTFKQNCASCHGNNLEGGTGPALKDIGKEHTKAEILKQIRNGGGGMPAGLIQGKEAENVAQWLAKKK